MLKNLTALLSQGAHALGSACELTNQKGRVALAKGTVQLEKFNQQLKQKGSQAKQEADEIVATLPQAKLPRKLTFSCSEEEERAFLAFAQDRGIKLT